MDQFANAAPKQRDEAFREATAQLELPELIVEKDFWICWSLKQLFKLPIFGDHMIFKGGTSLSNAYYQRAHELTFIQGCKIDQHQINSITCRDLITL